MSLGLSLNKKHIVFSVRYCKVVNCKCTVYEYYRARVFTIQYTQRMGFNLLNPIQIGVRYRIRIGFKQHLASYTSAHFTVHWQRQRQQEFNQIKITGNPLNSHKLLFCFCILPPRKSMKILVLWQQSKQIETVELYKNLSRLTICFFIYLKTNFQNNFL